MADFRPFDYGNVLAQTENIKGARIGNALAQRQLDPNSVPNQLQQEQLTGLRQGNAMAKTEFDQKQQQQNTQILYQALTEIAKNPAAADYHIPRLKQAGVLRGDFDHRNMTPEEISTKAAEGAAAIGQALKATSAAGIGRADSRPAAIQEKEYYDALTPEGKKTFLEIKRANPQAKFQDLNDKVVVADSQSGKVIAELPKGLAPSQTPENIRKTESVKETVAQESKKTAFKPKAKATILDLERQTEVVNKNIDKALEAIGPWSTGAGAWFKFMPNSEAGKLNRILETIKANIGFDKLQRMRDNSPTGGALGQVSEFENRLLQAVNGALDPSQKELLEENLSEIKRLYAEVLKERKAAYNADYGDEFSVETQKVEATKTLNGVTYQKINGKWFTQ